ncbi:protein FAM83H isoform 1-T3 [Acanthopagrus schlegelii]
MARRSQCSSTGDNPLDPNYLPPHYREEYRLAIDALVEEDLDGYYQFLQKADVVDFLSSTEIQYIQDLVQVPQLSNLPEQRFLDTVGDGSSDTYWPIHSDLDAPGLDLGWPQMHHLIGPTEVTTLVNPPEPDMPSIKEQARRLIKNAQQVIAIAMDMFTDVDIFHDILNAAMRNVAVYILLDEQNAHHFINMVSNCRVNLQCIQFLRVRTVSGITYHCRSGKSFQGQMMDRFLLTDCRAVLSGNYSFMWSFEKLNRCMAHLFLGQLVSTFDEEFRILFAQSKPLVIENVHAPMGDYSLLQKRQYPSERTSLYREPRKPDPAHLEDWARHSYDDRMDVDWRMKPLKRMEPMQNPVDIYSRFPSQQTRMDPFFDQGPSRMMENPAFKRHSYAEGAPGKYSHPFLQQQGMPEAENQGRLFHRGQLPYPGQGPRPGNEPDYGAYDKFWNQDHHLADQYSEPGLPQDMEPPDFDPVLNYLSTSRNVDFDQGTGKLPPAADVPFGSSHPKRLSVGQPYPCQTSPTPSNLSEQKQFFLEPNTDRKDPLVKRGLRDWRISSYLSAYENPEDEGLPFEPSNAPDAFEEPSNLIQQTMPGIDLPVSKIPNVREFKVPAVPRASQMPGYAKTSAREKQKKLPDEPTAVAAEPTPSESSSTAEGEKTEEAEQKEPKTALHRDESFRRKYNPAVQRSSRLRSSLIFSSLEQQNTIQDPQGEESDKNEAEQAKQPFVSQALGQRRSAARGPFEWSRYMKSSTFDNSATDTPDDGNTKADDKDSSKDDSSKDLSEKRKVQESSAPDEEQANSSPPVPRSKPSEAEMPKTDQPIQPPKPLLTNPLYVDMSDPDTRLMFFKELAAKRKAAEAEKSKEKLPMKPPTELKNITAVKNEEPVPQETAEKLADTTTSEGLQTRVSTVSNKTELEDSQPASTVPISSQPEVPPEPKLSDLAVGKTSPSHPPSPTSATPANVPSLAQGVNKSKNPPSLDTTSKESQLQSVKVPPSSAVVNSKAPNQESVQLETSIPPPLPELNTGGSQISPSPSPSSSAPLTTPVETISSNVPQGDSDSTPTSSILSPNAQKTVSPFAQSVEESSQKSAASSISQTESESTQAHVDSVSHLTSTEKPSVIDSGHLETDISPDTCAASPEPMVSSLQSTAETESEDTCPQKDAPESENSSVPQVVGDESAILGASQDAKADSTPPESCSPNVADVESRSDQNESIEPTPSPADPSPEQTPAETSSPVHSDLTPKASQSEKTSSPQDAPIQVTPPSRLNLTGPVAPCPAETVSCSTPQSESVGSVLSPEADKTLSALHSPSHTNSLPEQVTTDSNETPASSPAEPTSEVPTESKLPCKKPESVTSETHSLESPVPAGNSQDSEKEVSQEPEKPDPGVNKTDNTETTNKVDKAATQESDCSEKTNDQVKQNNCSEVPEIISDEVVPQSPQSRQPKSSQSRYQSSTANVLSSSNLRDDTKLLLEQISANSQSRSEATKESPVTDDEKEDEADKNAKREKEIGMRSISRGQQVKSSQERDKLLERIQSFRKERKVYSRFEMAP